MSDLQTAYKEVALAVWEQVLEKHPEDLAVLKRTCRVKGKGKKTPNFVSKANSVVLKKLQ